MFESLHKMEERESFLKKMIGKKKESGLSLSITKKLILMSINLFCQRSVINVVYNFHFIGKNRLGFKRIFFIIFNFGFLTLKGVLAMGLM